MAKFITLLLVLATFRENSAATCNFSFKLPYYICDLYDVNVQTESDVLDITGTHLNGYSNSLVGVVNISDSTMTILHQSILNTFPDAKELIITSAGLQQIPDKAFGAFWQLIAVYIHANPLLTLQAGVFAECDELKIISIQNGLKGFAPEIFHGLYNLRNLYLSNNSIDRLDVKMFQDNYNLELIDLSRNKITQFEALTFASLINLKTLNLRANQIVEIDANAFKSLEKLDYLYLDENNLTSFKPGTFTSLKILKYFLAGNNRIKSLSSNAFGQHVKLINFSISSNQLDEIEPNFFAAFPYMQLLYAEDNVCVNATVSGPLSIDSRLSRCFSNWNSARNLFPPTTEATTQGATSVEMSSILVGFGILQLLFLKLVEQ